jgi:ABC-type cobalamin/Fe3+-siderophores transport system ATPase subunit
VLLQAADLRFGYGRDRGARGRPLVIDDVSLGVEAGSLVGILGPNGSGKTTLLRLLSGTLRPASGEVRIGGVDLRSLSRSALARRLAVVPQETELAFDYSVIEIVLMGRYPHLGAFEIEGPADLAAALAALDATGLRNLAERPFQTLSGGEKQRAVIASALAQLDDRARRAPRPAPDAARAQPALLLLDEPTASLDLRYQLEVASLLTGLCATRGITIVLTTHDLRFAASICTTVVLLAAGRVLATGAPREVLTPARVAELYGIDEGVAAPLVPR